MKKVRILSAIAIALAFSTTVLSANKLVSTKTHIKFFSTTVAENIEANNNTSIGTVNTETGAVVFVVTMQGFEFEKALMQKHFNGDKFLDTKQFPTAKLKAKLQNMDLLKNNTKEMVEVEVVGEMTIKGVTKPVKIKGTVTQKEGKYSLKSKFNITLADYGIEFVKGKPSSNIAKTVEVTVHADFKTE